VALNAFKGISILTYFLVDLAVVCLFAYDEKDKDRANSGVMEITPLSLKKKKEKKCVKVFKAKCT